MTWGPVPWGTMCLVVALGCGPRQAQRKPSAVQPVVHSPSAPAAGTITDHRWTDTGAHISVDQAEGWGLSQGEASGALRARFAHSESGALVEIWRFGEPGLDPQSRAGCTWLFDAQAAFAGPPGIEDVRFAACTPEAPSGVRVMAWLVDAGGFTYQIELHAPDATLLQSLDLSRSLLAGVRVRP